MTSPTFVGVSSVVAVPGSGAATPVNVSAPAGLQDDDIVLLFHIKGNNATPSVLSAPDFGAEVVGFNNGTFNIDYGIRMLRASSEPASWSIQETASNTQGLAFAAAWRGVPPGASPMYEDLQTYLAPSTSASPNPLPAVTGSGADATLVGFVIDISGGTVTFTGSGSGSLVERYDHGASGRSFALYDEAISGAGSVSGRTVTPSGSARCRTVSILLPGTAPTAPVITGPTGSAGDAACAVNVAENQTSIGTWTATNGGTWSISGGADAARVQINGSGVVSFLTAKNFESPDDADTNGTYLFTVQNAGAGGTVTQDVTVTLTDVNEPPGAPTIGTATAGNASASVAFTPPAANGGPTPTSYTATSSPGGITGTGASSPIAVSGLTNGVEYTFTVTATNSEGTGPASAASNAVTPAAVTYSITSPAGGFASNTGSGARAPGVAFNWWAFAAKVIGDSLSGATMQSGSGTLNGEGRAVIPGLTLAGAWECQVRFADGGTARWTGTAA